MTTHLAQNQFITNSSDRPATEEPVAANPQPPSAATGPIPCSACGLSHNAVTQAVEVRPALPVSSEPSLPAVTPTAPVAAGFFDELEHLIGAAGKRRRRPLALPPFAPDFPAIWKAMHDKSAPRAVLDPLWADASPLFLQRIG